MRNKLCDLRAHQPNNRQLVQLSELSFFLHVTAKILYWSTMQRYFKWILAFYNTSRTPIHLLHYYCRFKPKNTREYKTLIVFKSMNWTNIQWKSQNRRLCIAISATSGTWFDFIWWKQKDEWAGTVQEVWLSSVEVDDGISLYCQRWWPHRERFEYRPARRVDVFSRTESSSKSRSSFSMIFYCFSGKCFC